MSKKTAKKTLSVKCVAVPASPEELQAMEKCRALLMALPAGARRRAIEWLCAAFGVEIRRGLWF